MNEKSQYPRTGESYAEKRAPDNGNVKAARQIWMFSPKMCYIPVTFQAGAFPCTRQPCGKNSFSL